MLSIILPVGFALLGLRLIEQGWAILTGRADGFQLADEAAEAMALDQRGKDDPTDDASARGGRGR